MDNIKNYILLSFVYTCIIIGLSTAFYTLYVEYTNINSHYENNDHIAAETKYYNLICDDVLVLNKVKLFEKIKSSDTWIYQKEDKTGTYREKENSNCNLQLI